MTRNVALLLERAAQEQPDRTFIITDETHFTFMEINVQAQRIAAALVETGVRPGQVVALLLPNTVSFVTCYFGALRLGAIVVPLNVSSPGLELAHFLQDSHAVVLITSEPLLRNAAASVSLGEGNQPILVVGAPTETDLSPTARWLEPLLRADDDFPVYAVGVDAPALMLYTSGTTGKPKAAQVTHDNIYAFTPVFGQDILELHHDSVVLMAAPGSHAIGQVLLNTATFAQCTLSLLPEFSPARFLQRVNRDQVTALISVPSLVQMLLAAPQGTEDALRSLNMIMIGGAALASDLAERFTKRFRVRLKVAYAMTEAYAITFGEVGEIADGSVGKPARGVMLRVVDETGNDVGSGQVGEILVQSPQIFLGYHNLPDQANAYWLDGWFRTGDLGRVDDTGGYFLVGRRKEIIKTSGYTVYPAEVESVLQAHPAVVMVAVVGVPHDSVGEIVVAAVVCKADVTVSGRELINFCKERLASYKCPRRVEFRDRLPLNSAGKVLRLQLVEELT